MIRKADLNDLAVLTDLALALWPDHAAWKFAGDCEQDHIGSLAYHLNMGLSEVNRTICFAKRL